MFNVAKNWKEYEEQGPRHKALADWWRTNFSSLGGEFNSSYHSWTNWYNQMVQNEWGGKHKGPNYVLKVLKSLDNKTSNTVPSVPKSKSYKPFRRSKVRVKSGADIENTTDEVKSFLDILAEKAIQLGYPLPVVTSGYRSPRSQARVMAKNWETHGGPNGGRAYLINLYADDQMASTIDEIFNTYGTKINGIRMASEYLEYKGGSSHMEYPSSAIDLRITSGIEEILKQIKQEGLYSINILNEGDHFHIKVESALAS